MTHAPRIYGSDSEAATGPEPGHDYRELVGGPLDGQLLDVTGWSEDMLACGAYLIAPLSAYGPGGRADYAPARRPGRAVRLGGRHPLTRRAVTPDASLATARA